MKGTLAAAICMFVCLGCGPEVLTIPTEPQPEPPAVEHQCAAHADCATCLDLYYCAWCASGSRCESLGPSRCAEAPLTTMNACEVAP